MGVVYQLTFFLSLGLLAIVVTIFVFTVSQIGRATESASKEQQLLLQKQKEAKERQIEKIQVQLEEAKKSGHLDESKLQEELQSTREEIKGYDNELVRIEERIKLIRRKGAVIWPGSFFLAASTLTIIASGLYDTVIGLTEGQNLAAFVLWIISVGALAYGIIRIYKTLGAIEEVTITSQEAIEKLPEAVKYALRELGEEKKPELRLVWKGQWPPFNIKSGTEETIKFGISLIKGEVARKPSVFFHAPTGFDFLGRKTYVQPDDRRIVGGGYITSKVVFKDIIFAVISIDEITFKAPYKAGKFILMYRICCEGFDSGFKEFEVVVE